MHSATDFTKIGTQAIKNYVLTNGFTHVCIIDENDSLLRKIAVNLYKENEVNISFLTL